MDAKNGKMNGQAHRPGWLDRVSSWLRPPTDPLLEARRQVHIARSEAELKVLQKNKKLLEDFSTGDFFIQPYLDLLDRTSNDFGDRGYFLSTYADRQFGRSFPFYINEGQLDIIRARARLVCTTNSYAIGLLCGLTSFVIGKGFSYKAVLTPYGQKKFDTDNPDFLLAVDDEIDKFSKLNQWPQLEQELFWRSREDGEFFLRYFESPDDMLIVRTVEPEQIRQEPGADYQNFSFGIHSDPEDVQTVYGYWVRYLAGPEFHGGEIGEEVPVDQIVHFRVNAKRSIKRGLSDFSFDAYDAIRAASKIRFNTGEGAAVQASIAMVRQWETATQASVQSFNVTEQDFNQLNPVTGKSTNFHQMTPGSIQDIPRGMAYIPPPASAPGAAEGHEIILHAQLRAAGTRWNCPEWLATASGSDMAAYTASLTAENPFVKTATRYQDDYERVYTEVVKRAVQVAIDAGRLPPDTFKLVEIHCEGPVIEAKDDLKEAQANAIRVQSGWKSRQLVIQEEGNDVEEEFVNIEEYQERFGGSGLEGTGSEGQPDGMQPPPMQQQGKPGDGEKGEEKPAKGLEFESMKASLPALVEHAQADQTKRTQIVLGAAAKLLAAAYKPRAESPASPPAASPDVKELCEAVKSLAAREPAPIQAAIHIPSELKIPQSIIHVAPPEVKVEAPIVNVTPPAITIQPPEVHVAAPEVISAPQDKPQSLKRDSQGRVCEITYTSGAVFLVKRDKEGRINKLVPKGS